MRTAGTLGGLAVYYRRRDAAGGGGAHVGFWVGVVVWGGVGSYKAFQVGKGVSRGVGWGVGRGMGCMVEV